MLSYLNNVEETYYVKNDNFKPVYLNNNEYNNDLCR